MKQVANEVGTTRKAKFSKTKLLNHWGLPIHLSRRFVALGLAIFAYYLAALSAAARFASRLTRRDAVFLCSTPFAAAFASWLSACATTNPLSVEASVIAARAFFTAVRTLAFTRRFLWRRTRLCLWRFSADLWFAIETTEGTLTHGDYARIFRRLLLQHVERIDDTVSHLSCCKLRPKGRKNKHTVR